MPTSSRLTLLPQSISPKPSRKKLSPIVAMNRMMCSWLTSGRSTSRSMAKASATITAVVRTSARATGTPRSISPTNVSAANSTITPWAKLNTPEALKISTKPRATREYMSPAATPPISTSTRKRGDPAMSLNGPTKIAYRSSMLRAYPASRRGGRSLMAYPQVGIDDGLVGPHLVRGAVGDLAAVVQRHHAAGDVHHHAHVVLDERDGRAEFVVDVEDEAAHVLLLLHVHARHGLVEQEEDGLGSERARQLDPLLEAIGQPAGRRLADGLDLQEVDDPLDEGPMRELLPHGRAPVQRLEHEAPLHLQEPPRHDVVEHAHALEEGDVLERAGDAERRHLVRPEARPVLVVEDDPPLVGVLEAADHVEQCRLAGAVGADDGHDLSAPDGDAHAVKRLHRPEADADGVDLEERGGRTRLAARHGGGVDGAHRASPMAKISASPMRTSARTVPVRPSSSVTWASTA